MSVDWCGTFDVAPIFDCEGPWPRRFIATSSPGKNFALPIGAWHKISWSDRFVTSMFPLSCTLGLVDVGAEEVTTSGAALSECFCPVN